MLYPDYYTENDINGYADYLQANVEAKDRDIEEIWTALEDVPMDENDKLLVNFFTWEVGADKYKDIWPWFDKNHSKGIDYLVNGFR